MPGLLYLNRMRDALEFGSRNQSFILLARGASYEVRCWITRKVPGEVWVAWVRHPRLGAKQQRELLSGAIRNARPPQRLSLMKHAVEPCPERWRRPR